MTRPLLIALVALAAAAAPAGAAALAPTKPSQLLTIQSAAGGPPAPCASVETPVRNVVKPDLSVGPLTIPEVQVLVVVSGGWIAFGTFPANRNVALDLYLKTSPSNESRVFVGAPARSDDTGRAFGSFEIQPDLVVRPGQTLCARFASSVAPPDPQAAVANEGSADGEPGSRRRPPAVQQQRPGRGSG